MRRVRAGDVAQAAISALSVISPFLISRSMHRASATAPA